MEGDCDVTDIMLLLVAVEYFIYHYSHCFTRENDTVVRRCQSSFKGRQWHDAANAITFYTVL